jgi:branched-chain amino acid transport system ATP-binding protein
MLELENVVSGYGRSVILHHISLTAGEGEAVSLLGRNGMGKTTTIRTVMGLLPARSGQIRFKGQDITNARPERISRLGIGYVPEGRGVFPTLSVYENLVMTARSGPWTLESIYSLFPQLYRRRNHMGNELSGGEQQMLSIGRALMLNPSFLILDEAAEGLAPLVQDEIWACLKKIKEAGLPMLIVDKDIAALLEIADRHYVIQKGEIRAVCTTGQMRESRGEIDRFLVL